MLKIAIASSSDLLGRDSAAGPLTIEDPDAFDPPVAAAARDAAAAADGAFWSPSGALMCPGLKHLCSNIEGDVLRKLANFKQFQEQLKAANTLLHQKYYRDRLKELFKSHPAEQLFKYHDGGNLIVWRWGSLVEVCKAMHKREGALRSKWSLQKFLAVPQSFSGAAEAHNPEGAGPDDDADQSQQHLRTEHQLLQLADKAWTSPFFWACVPLGFAYVMRGVFDSFLDSTLASVASFFLSAELAWAKGVLNGTLWHRSAARKFIDKYESSSTDPLTAFAKRPFLDDFLAGASLGDPEMTPLRQWLGALRLVRIVERATE
ncbi:unnamed protein product, partial [Symbiodinium necroappetens]